MITLPRLTPLASDGRLAVTRRAVTTAALCFLPMASFTLQVTLAQVAAPAGIEATSVEEKGEFPSPRGLTGTWGGLRTDLENKGVNFDAYYVTDLLANVSGGEEKGFNYAGELSGFIDLDLEKLLGLTGLSFRTSASWGRGRDISEERIGAFFPAAEIYVGRSARLFELYLDQKLLEEKVSIAAGRLSPGSDFATSDQFGYYVSGAINSIPGTLTDALPAFYSPPVASWGARVLGQPVDWLVGKVGVYNSDPFVGDDNKHGIDFSFNGDGVVVASEVELLRNQGKGDTGLPGTFRLGGLIDTRDIRRIEEERGQKAGNYAIYAIAEQMVYRPGGPDTEQGLTPWVAVAYAPQDTVSTVPVFAAGGLVYRGLLPARPEDTTALGFFYGRFSKYVQDTTGEKVLEANYRVQVTPWFYITPDFQFIMQPSGTSDINNAIVVGAEVGIAF